MIRTFNGKNTLATLQQDCMDIQMIKKANLTKVEGQNAVTPTDTKITVNVCTFDQKDDVSEVHDDLVFVKKSAATVTFIAKMVQESRTQIGDDMDVFIEDKAETILVFGKIT
jgi:hypothetical protein